MAKGDIKATVYGKHYKYEVRESGMGMSLGPTYVIYRDGKYWRGEFSTLKAAMRVLEKV